jgi:hypothetical protein
MSETETNIVANTGPKRVKVRMRVRTGIIYNDEDELTQVKNDKIRSISNSTKPQVPKFNFPSLNLILKQASKGLLDFFLNIATNISVEAIVNQSDLNIAEQSKLAINIEALTKVKIPSTPNSTNEKIRNDYPQIFSNQDRMLYSTAVKNPPPKIAYRRKMVTTQQAR